MSQEWVGSMSQWMGQISLEHYRLQSISVLNIAGRSNLGPMRDDVEDEAVLLRKQREEVAMLKEQMSSQVCPKHVLPCPKYVIPCPKHVLPCPKHVVPIVPCLKISYHVLNMSYHIITCHAMPCQNDVLPCFRHVLQCPKYVIPCPKHVLP